jgi:hypothetical protein
MTVVEGIVHLADLSSNPVTLTLPSFKGSNFYDVIEVSPVLQTARWCSEDGHSRARGDIGIAFEDPERD